MLAETVEPIPHNYLPLMPVRYSNLTQFDRVYLCTHFSGTPGTFGTLGIFGSSGAFGRSTWQTLRTHSARAFGLQLKSCRHVPVQSIKAAKSQLGKNKFS